MATGEFSEAQAERAFATILQAERQAQDTVERCKAQCEALVAGAHRRSGEIATRAEERISGLRDRMNDAVERRIAEIARSVEAPAGCDGGGERLERAVTAVARELTGAA